MSEILYMQINKNIEVNKNDVTVGDVAALLCGDNSMAARIKTIKLVSIPDVPKRRVCFSVMKVIEEIHKIYPNLEINNIGESDFIIDYIKQKKTNTALEMIVLAGVCLLTFLGSAYAIMAYNNDVSTNEIFERVYEMFGVSFAQDYNLLEICYAAGLLLGIVIFYNHFAGRKLGSDPSPIQVEMNKYEKDIDDTLIDRSNAEGKEKTAV
jgi:stage V sporulation protein AA